jgi:hypothetical protein
MNTNELDLDLQPPTKVAPAPWTLTGSGHIILAVGQKSDNLHDAAIPHHLQDSYSNICNIMMFVDYKSSPVGPYRELLFIPGTFRFADGKRHFSISKIYVDSYDSTWNGRKNWGIPKEMATFSYDDSEGYETVRVAKNGRDFASYHLRKKGPTFPCQLSLVPHSLRTFAELLENMIYIYTFSGKGQIQWAQFKADHFDSSLFPDMTKRRSLIALKVTNFELTFPVARIMHALPQSIGATG